MHVKCFRPRVFLNTYEVIHEALVEKAVAFAGRPVDEFHLKVIIPQGKGFCPYFHLLLDVA